MVSRMMKLSIGPQTRLMRAACRRSLGSPILVLADANDRMDASCGDEDLPRCPFPILRVVLTSLEGDHVPADVGIVGEAQAISVPRENRALACRDLAGKDETASEQVEQCLLESCNPSGNGDNGTGDAQRLQDICNRCHSHGDRLGDEQRGGDIDGPQGSGRPAHDLQQACRVRKSVGLRFSATLPESLCTAVDRTLQRLQCNAVFVVFRRAS